jgi:hypothetical protein
MTIIVGILATACFFADSAERKSILKNQTLWESAGIENYEFVYRRICFCPPEISTPVSIEVRDGEVWSVAYRDSEVHLDPPDTTAFPTIPNLFVTLLNADEVGAHKMTFAFDPEFGFLLTADIDYKANTIDEKQAFRVTEFVRK